jgi:hypothetical protein
LIYSDFVGETAIQGNSMKLSAFLAISVPIVAASQMPAQAAEPTVSGAWLQESISELTPAKAKMATTSYSAAQKHVVHVVHAAPISPNAVKLRPFKPGRYLPSEKELRAAAVQAQQVQQAQYDYSAPGAQLNGQVNAQGYAAPMRQQSAYDQYAMPNGYAASMPAMAASPIAQRVKAQIKRAIGQRAPRVVPNQMPMLPEQLTQAPMLQPQIPEPPAQRQQMRAPFPVSMPVGQFPQPSAQQMSQPMAPQFQPDNISPQEVQAMFRQAEMSPPQARMNFNGEVVGQALDNPGNGGGQPPFPLNIFGGNALGNLTQSQHGMGMGAGTQQARFGSWHGGSSMASAGFHSYVARRKPVMYEYSRAPMANSSRRTRAQASAAPSPISRRAYSAPPAMASRVITKPVVVATYPSSYASYRSAY